MPVEDVQKEILRRIRDWLLFVNMRFSSHFYHWVVLLWRPRSMVDVHQGERVGSVFLIRSGAFCKREELQKYLLHYVTFLNESEAKNVSFADYIFREKSKKPICLIVRSNRWEIKEDAFNAVAGIPQVCVYMPCSYSCNGNSVNTESYDEIFGNNDYPFHPDSPLIGSRHLEDEIIVNVREYPCCSSCSLNGLFNDFDNFQEVKEGLVEEWASKSCDHQGDIETCHCNGCLVYKGLKLLCIIPDWKTILFVPVPVISTSGEEVAFMGVVVFTRLEPEEIYREGIAELDEVVNSIFSMGIALSFHQVMDLAIGEVKTHALRSAVAAIMARNMSHHEGSHILPRARISDIRKRYKQLFCSPLEIPLEILENLKNRLDEYIAKKQDFLAEITSEPLMTTKTAYFWQDVLAPLVQNVLFMDTIAANEGIGYDRIKFSVLLNNQEIKAKFSCTQHPSIIYPEGIFPYNSLCSQTHQPLEEGLLRFAGTEEGSDFAVELPGPLGEHAFYAFLENLLRNAAKHNLSKLQNNPNNSLEVTIKVSEENEEFYRVEVSENLTPAGVKDRLSEYLTKPIVEETGEVRREAWGIAEMKVAAALLKGSTEWHKLEGDSVKEFLSIDSRNDQIVYRFYMMRPKKVCALMPGHKMDSDAIQHLKKAGIWICGTIEELRDLLLKSRSPASFKFAFLDLQGFSEQELQSLKELEPYLPFRIIVRINGELQGTVREILPSAVFVDTNQNYDFSKPQQIVSSLWRLWLKRWTPQAELHLYLEQEANNSPTSEWRKLAQDWKDTDYRLFMWYDVVQHGQINQKYAPKGSNNNLPRVIFDRHAIVASRLNLAPKRLGIQDAYFAFDKLSSDFIWIYSSQPSEELVYSLLEAGLLRVLVVDSRIAERAYDYDAVNEEWLSSLAQHINRSCFPGVPPPQKVRPDPMRWHMGCIGKVFICTHFGINSNPTPLHPQAREFPYLKLKMEMKDSSVTQLLLCIKSNDQQQEHCISIDLKNSQRSVSAPDLLKGLDVDMIIIHQGDIDTRKPSDNFNYEEFIASLKRLVPFVIIDSGRGVPVEVQKTPNAKFLPYSLLGAYLGGKRVDKARLTQVVMPLTRRVER